MRVGIFSGDAARAPRERLLTEVVDSPAMEGASLAEQVATDTAYVVPAVGEKRLTVAAVDLGIKSMTPQLMAQRGIEVHVLPAAAERRRGPGRRARRRLLLQRPRRPGDGRGPGRAAARGDAGRHPVLRHLLRQPDPRQGARVRHLQAEVRAPGHQPAGHGPHHRQGRGHRAQPRLRRRRPARPRHRDPLRDGVGQPRLPQRRRRRGPRGAPRRAARRLLGPVPPGGRGRPARRRLPLRPVRRPHDEHPAPEAAGEVA